ncbi:FIST N-terminal domain-containing protein [Rhodoferax sp. GW822-FHT02A01]|uniref:FIST signal transduction protein n=1 Tax=Rhodoferax sp. GW822-FHT02A01 TaxID=3141537 RepID=UPI00315D1517
MRISQQVFTAESLQQLKFDNVSKDHSNQLVLIFGSPNLLRDRANFRDIRHAFPKGLIVGCSTAGEIHDTNVSDDTLVVTVVDFEHTWLHMSKVEIVEPSASFSAGLALAASLPAEELVHVLVFSDGLRVNGTALVLGMKNKLPAHVEITGGLSADGADFLETLVCANDVPTEGLIVAVGLYGSRIKVGYGSLGGWDPFGPEREITRSEGNVLFDLDGKPALDLYKLYLGEQAAGLPATGLLFPLSLRYPNHNGGSVSASSGVVRTILAINEADRSMTFAGDMPMGGHVRLMKANFERLIDGACGAAKISAAPMPNVSAQLALLISCVGRKLVLKQRVEEEVEGVRDVLGINTVLAGYYSYGEISPHKLGESCELHNQTMTITTFIES